MVVIDSLTFVTTANLVESTYSLSAQLPPDIDAILGIARSGLIPATTLACHLHLPLYSVSDKVIECGSGSRFPKINVVPRKLLVIDDTIFAGRTLKKVLPIVRSAFPQATIVKGCIYATPEAKHLVDYFACELAQPHYLEWNLFSSVPGQRAIYDMDGILCEDISAVDDDDARRYVYALKHAVPKYLPRKGKIYIVTARLERYRGITLEWLDRHKVNVEKLVMGPWDTACIHEVAAYKATVYRYSARELFVESCPIQAVKISNQSGKRVLCPVAKRVFTSGNQKSGRGE